ncbi:MAG: photosystem II protein PsbQ [Elainella sp.]
MARFRSLLALILVLVTTLLVSCGNPSTAAKGPLYTTAQLEQIQRYGEDIQSLQDRLPELLPLIEQEQWNDVISFIHGPLGELRVRMSRLARTLEPKAQKQAQDIAKAVFNHLNAIDEAAQARDFAKASSNYSAALKDLDSFFQLIPG